MVSDNHILSGTRGLLPRGSSRTSRAVSRRRRRSFVDVFSSGLLVALVGVACVGVAGPAPTFVARSIDLSAMPHERPVPGQLVRPFDLPEKRWLRGHRGVDLAAAQGALVRASGDGRVVTAGTVVDRPVVALEHEGFRTTYEPVSPTVSVGTVVRRGDVIGTIAQPHEGCPTQWCLHWGARRGSGRASEYFDPLVLLASPRAVLLPLGEDDL